MNSMVFTDVTVVAQDNENYTINCGSRQGLLWLILVVAIGKRNDDRIFRTLFRSGYDWSSRCNVCLHGLSKC